MEEFTFPSIPPEHCNAKKLSFPYFASPPPWFVGPGGGAADAAAHDHRRCFSAVEHDRKANNDDYFYHGSSERFAVVEEHKMDMLWEDFNEELARAAPPPCPLSKEWGTEAWLAGDRDGDGSRSRHVVAVASGSVVRRRRLSLLMMLKLLKKLFLARKSKATSLPQGRRHQSDQ